MSIFAGISRQATDLLSYVLIPIIAILTPASFSRALLRRVSSWRWLLSEASLSALAGAARHGVVTNEIEWLKNWKQVELMDVRDLYMMLFGRSRSVLNEITCNMPIEDVRDRVMVGMHWGPGISVLKLLAEESLQPSFPYRPPEKTLSRLRPFYYVSSRLAALFLVRTLGERAVPVGGAGKVVAEILENPGSLCVLMDAPPMSGRRLERMPVLNKPARFNTGFPALLVASGKEYFLYAMNLCSDGSLRKQLNLVGPFSAEKETEFLCAYANFLDDHLAGESWHWRIWHAENQFWD